MIEPQAASSILYPMLPRSLILHATGTNRDLDAAQALELAGSAPEIVHLNQLRRGERRWADYQLHEGLLVPMSGEVAWLLPPQMGGRKVYWRGTVETLRYERAGRSAQPDARVTPAAPAR